MAAPIPSTASFTVTDLGGATFGGGPHNMVSAKTIQAKIDGTLVDLGPFLIRNLKTQAVGSKSIPFIVTLEPNTAVTAGNFDWNSVDVSEWMWWCLVHNNGPASPLKFIYKASSAAKSTSNPEITIHIVQLPNSPNIPGTPDTPETYTVEILADYILIDDGTNTVTKGTALA